MTEKPVLHSSEIPADDKAISDPSSPYHNKPGFRPGDSNAYPTRLAEPKPVKPYVPPSKGPVETERVEGLTDVTCAHCLAPIVGRYRTAWDKRYHYPNTGYADCRKAWEEAVGTETTSAIGKLTFDKALRPEVYEASRPASEPGRKDDGGKIRYSLLPWAAITEVVKVLEHGARKYAPENWRKVPEARQRYADAAMRHKLAYESGEVNDPESGLPHKAHEACCNLFILAMDLAEGKYGNQE